jgi:hypothetical protein
MGEIFYYLLVGSLLETLFTIIIITISASLLRFLNCSFLLLLAGRCGWY